MNDSILAFFAGHEGALSLYEALENAVLARCASAQALAQRTQITFRARRVFACASFLPVRRAKDRPAVYLTVTFGLARALASPRVDAVAEPYPGRFTHHVLVASPEQIDEELLLWIDEAFAFAQSKR